MTETAWQNCKKRSFIHHMMLEAGASFVAIDDAACASRFPNENGETMKNMALVDLSPLPRTGFKGRGTAAWLAGQPVSLPEKPNTACRQANGTLIVRLAPEEFLILDDLKGDWKLCNQLERNWIESVKAVSNGKGFPVPRAHSHCWFLVTGDLAPQVFAKLCGIDLRLHKFSDLQVAQSQAARISIIIIRDDQSKIPAFHLLVESALAEYFWRCLLDAMKEFEGQALGLDDLRSIHK